MLYSAKNHVQISSNQEKVVTLHRFSSEASKESPSDESPRVMAD